MTCWFSAGLPTVYLQSYGDIDIILGMVLCRIGIVVVRYGIAGQGNTNRSRRVKFCIQSALFACFMHCGAELEFEN